MVITSPVSLEADRMTAQPGRRLDAMNDAHISIVVFKTHFPLLHYFCILSTFTRYTFTSAHFIFRSVYTHGWLVY